MEFLRLLGLGLAASLLLVLMRRSQPELALVLSLAVGAMILLLLLPRLRLALGLLTALSVRAGVHLLYVRTILKILGISYLAEFGAQVSRDAGESAVAGKIELAGKLLILVMAIPIVSALLTTVLRLVD